MLCCWNGKHRIALRIQVVILKEKTGVWWAEVPSVPGCASQGDTIAALVASIREAIHGCLVVDREEAEYARPPRPAAFLLWL